MKKILIKETDKFTSTLFKNKVISQYIIYYYENDVKIKAFIEIGDDAKEERINDLIVTHFWDNIDNVLIEETLIDELKNK